MSYQTRDWAAAFVAAAAVVTTQDRQVNQRTRIEWRELPDKLGKNVAMSPIHGHIYQALVANTKLQDMDADSIESDATTSQVALTSMWSVSQTEQVLKDLERVGFIHRTRRHNQSSLTTIFRTPGNFDGKRRATKAAVPEKIDVPALAKRILDALDSQGLTKRIKHGEYREPFSNASRVTDADFEMRLEEALHPCFILAEPHNESALPVEREYADAIVGCLNGVLPSSLRAARIFADSVGISMSADEIARKLLRLIKGSDVLFKGFDPDIRDREHLGFILSIEVLAGSDEWRKVQASDDPTTALNEVARERSAFYDYCWKDGFWEEENDENDG